MTFVLTWWSYGSRLILISVDGYEYYQAYPIILVHHIGIGWYQVIRLEEKAK